MATLGEDLHKQMTRVRNIIPSYQSLGPVGNFAISLIQQDLDLATQAIAENDIPAMMKAYRSLKEYKG